MGARVLRRPASATYLLSLLLLTACATSLGGTRNQITGAAGPVEWEVTDVGRIDRADGMRTRWSFTIVLREKAGTSIQFERVESGSRAANMDVIGGMSQNTFNRRLEAGSELRYSVSESWGWASQAPGNRFGGMARLGNLTIERRFIGRDANGRAIVVPVRMELHQGFGRRSRQPASSEAPLPPARQLQATDLAGLAGRWEGYYDQSNGFHVPVEAAIREDGTVEFAENDPVTNRFRRSLSIRDGRL